MCKHFNYYCNMRAFVYFCFFVVFLFLSICVVFGKPQSPEGLRCYKTNEIYTECGPSCEKTCDNMLETAPSYFCTAQCVPGCFCAEGFVRNRWGNCIPKENCPCHNPDEVYICGSACQATCDNINGVCAEKSLNCVTECNCRPGYVRDNSGTCIPSSMCPGLKS